jgi:uncharacterized protein with HEPN domain
MPSDQVRRRLQDIKINIARIRRHIAGLDEAGFAADEKTRDAVERCLERISEAARKLGDGLDAAYPEIALPKLRQFGSVLRHDYDLIEPGLVWLTVATRLGLLERMCDLELSR